MSNESKETPMAGFAGVTCSACGQPLQRHVKVLHPTNDTIYISTRNGRMWARCPDCGYNMRPKSKVTGNVYECPKCKEWWRVET